MEVPPIGDRERCRLCLEYIKHLLPIFGTVCRDKNVSRILQTHLHLEVKEDEAFPKHICLNCLETVERFVRFYTDVAQNQSFLVQSGTDTTSGIVYQNEEYLEHDGDVVHEEVVIEEPVDLDESFIVHCTSREESSSELDKSHDRSNPPSYYEAQLYKHVQFDDIVKSVEHIPWSTDEHVVDDHSYIENVLEENEHISDGDFHLISRQNIGKADSDEEKEPDEETKEEDTPEVDGGETGIIVKVNKFKYPRMIRDGKLLVRGEVLDRCLDNFYGLTCEVCQQKESTMEALFTHYRNEHNVKGYVTCCGRKIVKRLLMAMHMAKHLEPEAFECPHCKKMMTTPRILRFHIRNHLPEEQRPLQCDICPRRFSYISGLLTHASTHRTENKSNRAYQICNDCGRAYRTRARLLEHIAASHAVDGGGEQCARCDVCGKKFTSKSNLTYHMTTHEPNVHAVQCGQCGKWLKNKICLRKHMLQHSDLRYQCGKCDYTATSAQRMQSHLRVQHTDEKPFVCQVCGKGFKLRCNLRSHLPQHTGERKFTCEFCSRQFASSSNYYSHRKRMHFEEVEQKRKQKELKDRDIRTKLKKQ